MSGKQWLIQRIDSGKYLQVEVKRKGGRFHCGSVQCVINLSSRLGGDIYLSIDSAKSLVLVDEFTQGLKPDLLRIQIESRLENLALLDVGVQGAMSYKRLTSRGGKQLLSITVLPKNELLAAYRDLTTPKKSHIRCCVTSTASIAALLALISPESYIVLLIQQEKAAVLAVQNGTPLYFQAVPLVAPGTVEMEMVVHALDFCRQTLRRDLAIESMQFLCMGSGREDVDYDFIEEQKWEPDWQKYIVTDSGQMLLHPELYGALFAGTDFSLLPKEYGLSWKIKRITGAAMLCAGVGGVVLSLMALQNVQKSIPLSQKLKSERSILVRQEAKLQGRLPKAQDVQHLERYFGLLVKGAKEPRLALLIENIVSALPEKVIIAGFAAVKSGGGKQAEADNGGGSTPIAPVPGGGETAAVGVSPEASNVVSNVSEAEAVLDKELVFSLTCTSEGENDRIRARFEKTVIALSQRFVLENIQWGYTEASKTGFFNCDLRAKNEKM